MNRLRSQTLALKSLLMSQSSNTQIPLDLAQAVSTPLQGILYGLSVYMFGVTFLDLTQRHGTPSGKINRTMLTSACLLFITSTMNVVVSIYREVNGLIMHRNTLGGPVAYFADLASWHWIFMNVLFLIGMLLGDTIVAYRCYVVWSSIWIIVLPVLLGVTTLATGITLLWNFARSNPNIFNPLITRLTEACFISSLGSNTMSTCLLAYRLWIVDHRSKKYHTSNGNLLHVARIVLDSGAIYSTCLALFVAFYLAKSNVCFILRDLMMPITSICFYMVLIRSAHRTRLETKFDHSLKLDAVQHNAGHLHNVEIHLNKDVSIPEDLQDSQAEYRRLREAEPTTIL
ncbi:hypothetical protein E4T56_gene12236 [Termitomyces sp. T112]|nr:hypothetical protein E4T56_gene12236 [Termitomyces sp. T112]